MLVHRVAQLEREQQLAARASGGADELSPLERLLGRDERNTLTEMLDRLAKLGESSNLRAAVVACSVLTTKALELGDTGFVDQMLKAGLEVCVIGGAACQSGAVRLLPQAETVLPPHLPSQPVHLAEGWSQ
eukprot:SAG31_NODE_240_length_19407_cov_29.686140_15_plen_131_part_00